MPAPTPEATRPRQQALMVEPPDAPILLIVNTRAHDTFGYYLGEILRAEGLNGFRTARLAVLTPAYLARFAVAILTEGALTDDEAAMLTTYVATGGSLIAMRPDPRLAQVLGVRFTGGSLNDGYMQTSSTHPLTRGISIAPLRFHGSAHHLVLDGAEAIAHRTDPDTASESDPLITVYRFGPGLAACWSFDLAHNVALLRQGNPDAVNQERDGLEGVRTQDLFIGWNDLNHIAVPHADEQQRMLSNQIHAFATRGPIPRLWYFPTTQNAVLVATSDAHGVRAMDIEEVTSRAERYGGSASIYYATPPTSVIRRTLRRFQWQTSELPLIGPVFDVPSPYPRPTDVERWRDKGHGFGLHPFVEQGVEAGYNAYWNDFLKHGYGTPSPTVRTHRVLWTGWVETARVQARYGIRMNLDFYQCGPVMQKPSREWATGYLNGTGLPLPFVDEHGEIIGVYQQPTHLVDEHLMPLYDTGYDVGLDAEAALAISQQAIKVALGGNPTAIGFHSHADPFSFEEAKRKLLGQWLDGTLEYATAHNVPIMSAERWLAFTEMRHDTEIQNLGWNDDLGQLHFTITTGKPSAYGLMLLLPYSYNNYTLGQIFINDTAAAQAIHEMGGIRFAAVTIAPGSHQVMGMYRRG